MWKKPKGVSSRVEGRNEGFRGVKIETTVIEQ